MHEQSILIMLQRSWHEAVKDIVILRVEEILKHLIYSTHAPSVKIYAKHLFY